MLGEPWAILPGVIITGAAVGAIAGGGEAFVGHGADGLAVAQHQIIGVGPHLQHRLGALTADAPAGVKKASVVGAKFPRRRIVGHHFAGEIHGHHHPLGGG